jgi:hypothetical protein
MRKRMDALTDEARCVPTICKPESRKVSCLACQALPPRRQGKRRYDNTIAAPHFARWRPDRRGHRGCRVIRFAPRSGLRRHPAWRELGVQAWADYSRHADLHNGLVVYSVGGILCWVVVFAAALACRFDRSAPRQARPPLYLAALAALGAIVTTIVAAPTMMHVGQLTDTDTDTAALHNAFETFTLWGVYVRGACFAVIFVCSVWALVTYFR